MKTTKSLFSIILALILICNLSLTTFATSEEQNVVFMSYGYIPHTAQNNRSIIGTNDLGNISNTSDYPYSAIAQLDFRFSCNCSGSGSGFMIAKNCMLTAGHCLVCDDHQEGISSMTIRFGINEYTGHTVLTTTVTEYNAVFYTDENFSGTEKNYDYGYVGFETNIGYTTGWLSLMSLYDALLEDLGVTVTGYDNAILKSSSGSITSVTDKRIKYDADTLEGMSGAPVYYYDPERGYLAVGIHTLGTSLLNWRNSGYRVTYEFMILLEEHGYITVVAG